MRKSKERHEKSQESHEKLMINSWDNFMRKSLKIYEELMGQSWESYEKVAPRPWLAFQETHGKTVIQIKVQ